MSVATASPIPTATPTDEVFVLAVAVRQPTQALLTRTPKMLRPVLTSILGNEVEEHTLRKRTSLSEASSGLLHGAGFHCLVDHGYPFVKASHVETAERLSESKISDNVESSEVEPINQIEFLVLFGHSRHVIDQLVQVALDDVFLLDQCLLAESMRQRSALPSVVLIVGHGESRYSSNSLY
jgi:hypothetical protein